MLCRARRHCWRRGFHRRPARIRCQTVAMTERSARKSPLYDRHAALGAKLANFGGWEMPIEYAPDGGVLAEHAAVREAVGVFDVTHLGKAAVRGPGAAAFVNTAMTNDLGRIQPPAAQYTLCCEEASGGGPGRPSPGPPRGPHGVSGAQARDSAGGRRAPG